ncbi:MAG: hypothetical protein HY550_04220 [Elusimicrobia bacterium]|nr:hypothetical protein [Elusimicrobiota bacterium]
MAEIKNFRELFDRIPVYGESGFAAAARLAVHDSSNLKKKNTDLRRYGRASGLNDLRQTFLAADLPARKSFRYRF